MTSQIVFARKPAGLTRQPPRSLLLYKILLMMTARTVIANEVSVAISEITTSGFALLVMTYERVWWQFRDDECMVFGGFAMTSQIVFARKPAGLTRQSRGGITAALSRKASGINSPGC